MIPGVASSAFVGLRTTGLSLPGTSGNYASVPDSADLSITGDLAISADLAMVVWKPSTKFVLAKLANATSISYDMFVGSTGKFTVQLSSTGSNAANAASSVAPTVSDGAPLCIGFAYRNSDGRVQFWTAPTGTATAPGGEGWTQLGTDQTISTATIPSIYDSTSPVEIGSRLGGTSGNLAATFKRVQIWASVDGTDQRLDANFVGQTKTATRTPTSFTETAKSATVTLNGTGWDWSTT